jgi:CubicO group peptidase (beta-lactamase class C family)
MPKSTPVATSRSRCLFTGSGSSTRKDSEYVTDYWTSSPPEEQGFDARLLSTGLVTLDKSTAIYSFLVVRHGVLVVEKYFNGSSQADSNEIASITKSFISALTGIAIREGYLQNPQQKLADLLPEYFSSEANQTKKEISLQDLLTMSAGFKPSPFNANNWVKEAIDMPLVTEPGTYFWYNSALPHILSVLISKTSGMQTCEFAFQYLFDPLNLDF